MPRHQRSTLGCRAFSVAGPIVWNSLSYRLRDDSEESSFKQWLKTLLFSLLTYLLTYLLQCLLFPVNKCGTCCELCYIWWIVIVCEWSYQYFIWQALLVVSFETSMIRYLKQLFNMRLKLRDRHVCSKSVISLQRGLVDQKFQVEGVAPTNHSFSQKTRLNDLSYGIKIWTGSTSVLSQFMHSTDGWTDRQNSRC